MWSGASHPEIDFGPSGPTWIKGTDASTRFMLIDFKLASRQQQLTWISETLHSYPSLFLSDSLRLVAALRKNLSFKWQIQ